MSRSTTFYQRSMPDRYPPIPMPFHMTEPFQQNNLWYFWLTAEETELRFVGHLSCVLSVAQSATPLTRRPGGRMLVAINPRYDYQEAWLWIYDLLEGETRAIELHDVWETAIDDAYLYNEEGEAD